MNKITDNLKLVIFKNTMKKIKKKFNLLLIQLLSFV